MQNVISSLVSCAAMILTLGYTPSNATTVKEYKMYLANSNLKPGMEMYAMGVGQGFFWYSITLRTLKSEFTMQNRLFCPPGNMPFTGEIILNAAKRATERYKDDETFELTLLKELMDMFPCK